MSIFCIGKLTYDIFCLLDEMPQIGKKYFNKERVEHGGGEVANAAYLMGKWGLKPMIAGVVGADDFGTKIKKELEGVQIDTSLIETSYEKPTILSLILVNKNGGANSVIRSYKNEFAALRKQDLGLNPDIILADGHEYGATHLLLERNPKAISILTAEENKPEILELCKFSKYILCSKEFAESITNIICDFDKPASLLNLYQAMKNRFPNNEIVVTLKNRGALYSNNGEIKIMPGINCEVKDLTGAGDAFKGAFVYGISNNFDMDKIITYANIAAGLTIQNIGVRNAFPTLGDVVNYYNQKFPPQINAAAPTNTENMNIAPNANESNNQNAVEPIEEPIINANENLQNIDNITPNEAPMLSTSQENVNNNASMGAIPDVMPEIPKN